MQNDPTRQTVHVKSLNRWAAILYPGDDPGNWCVQLYTGECLTVSEDDLELLPQSLEDKHDKSSASRPLLRVYDLPLRLAPEEMQTEGE